MSEPHPQPTPKPKVLRIEPNRGGDREGGTPGGRPRGRGRPRQSAAEDMVLSGAEHAPDPRQNHISRGEIDWSLLGAGPKSPEPKVAQIQRVLGRVRKAALRFLVKTLRPTLLYLRRSLARALRAGARFVEVKPGAPETRDHSR